MAVYGNNYFINLNEDNLFILESDLISLNEAVDLKKLKNIVIETISKTVNKIVMFVSEKVKALFKFITGGIDKLYNGNEVRDKIFEKIIKDLSYSDLEKAEKNGWNGIETLYPMVGELKLENSRLVVRFNQTKNSIYKYDFQGIKFLERCLENKKYDRFDNEIESIYDDIKKSEETIKDAKETFSSLSDIISDYNINNKMDIAFNTKDNKYAEIFYTDTTKTKIVGEKEYYIPSKESFERTKNMAINGQKYINTYKVCSNNSISDVKKVEDDFSKNVTNFKETDDQEYNKRYIKLLNLHIDMAKFQLKVYTDSITETIKVLKFQHKIAFKSYLEIAKSIKKYINIKDSGEINIEKYFKNGEISRAEIVSDVKRLRINNIDIERICSNEKVKETFFGDNFNEWKNKIEKDFSKNKNNNLDLIACAAVAEIFNKEYLLYLYDYALKVNHKKFGYKKEESI